MKKKLGFTLIELLAVIVILAIIALIAVPTVLNIIKDAKIRAAIQSAYGYIDAVNLSIARNQFDGEKIIDDTYDILENDLGTEYEGTIPSKGIVTISKRHVTMASLCINGYSIEYENGTAIYDENSTICPIEYKFIEPEGTIISEICDGTSEYKEGSYKIKTVEDLVCFGKLVDEGNNFSNSTVMLLSDLDIQNTKTYKDSNALASYDINGNGTIESIYTELTTEAGFNPIGTSSNVFSGTFEGYGFYINNLYINRTSESSVGLFANNTGTIQGLNLTNLSISGTSRVGGVSGSNIGTINEINISGNIVGTGNDIGGAVGLNYRQTSSEISIVKNVLANMNVSGISNVGGIVGRSGGYYVYSGVYGIIDGGSVTGSSNVGKLIGNVDNYVNRQGYAKSTVTITGSSGISGTSYDNSSTLVYESVLDTYVGGDSDSSGYYFDYDESGEFVVKSIEREPIENTLKGSGIESDPYIIKNTDDWKIATATVKEGYYYELGSNLDFTNKYFYPMGSINNYFTGYLDGNMYTIKNIDVEGVNYAGIFGYSTGEIEGINFENITITGDDYVGLIGYNTNSVVGINATDIDVIGSTKVGGLGGSNSGIIQGLNLTNVSVSGSSQVGGVSGSNIGTINEINISGNIVGTGNDIGGAVGLNYRQTSSEISIIKNVLANMNVSGISNVGGIVGRSGGYYVYSGVYGIIDGGSVTGSSNVGKLIGYVDNYVNRGGYSYSGVILTGSSGISGTSFDSTYLNNLEYYSNILDITDSDNTGYYFGYNSDSSDIIVKAS